MAYKLVVIGRYMTEHQEKLEQEVLTYAAHTYRTPYAEQPLHYMVIARSKYLRDIIEEFPFPTQFNLERPAQQLPNLTESEAWYRETRDRASVIFANLILAGRISCWMVQRRIIT